MALDDCLARRTLAGLGTGPDAGGINCAASAKSAISAMRYTRPREGSERLTTGRPRLRFSAPLRAPRTEWDSQRLCCTDRCGLG